MYKATILKSAGLSRSLYYKQIEEKVFNNQSEAIEFAEKYIAGRYGIIAYIKEKTKVMNIDCFVEIKMCSMFAGKWIVSEI